MSVRSLCCALVALALPSIALAAEPPAEEPTSIGWKKTVVEQKFRSEGVAVADVNKDGKNDILVGDVWYENPSWRPHEIRTPTDYKDGSGGYSKCFACWADDINGDGWQDLVLVGFPGAPCYWYENPQNRGGHWGERLITKSACNETPQYVDLFGNGKRVLVKGFEEKKMIWAAPGKDPTQPWAIHLISDESGKAPGSGRFDHGLGVGDVNGDGRLDVMVPGAWWEQPAKPETSPWKMHKAGLGAACADMYCLDMNGDGANDVLSSSAHNYGIWAHIQQPSSGGESSFKTETLFPKAFSQSHAMNFIDVNGDGKRDLVTGKRWWAHGPRGDADPADPAVIYWFEQKAGADGKVVFSPHKIDDDSGIGTQFWTGDFNGDNKPDVVVSNKKGVFLIEQTAAK